MFSAGAYMLLSTPDSDESSLRQVVNPPSEDPAKAPNWVEQGQTAKPDYTPVDAQAQNATPAPVVEEKTTNVIEIQEDRVVTFTFAESLTDYLLNRFVPQDGNGKPTTLASIKSLNVYFGQEMDGFSVQGDDIRQARQALLDYAFTPTMIKTLYELYNPVLMAQIVESAANDERNYTVGVEKEHRTLEDAETAVMLKLNALRIEQAATILRAIGSDPKITDMAGQYLQAQRAVGRANAQLQNAIADDKSTSKASQRLKQSIMQREQVKNSLVTRMKKACPGCADADLFYLAQWGYRRVLGEPKGKLKTFDTAASVLDDLAQKFRETSKELK